MQGANQGLQGIASVIGPMIFGLTFTWAIHDDAGLHMPGLPIFIASALLVGAFLLSIRVGHAPREATGAAAAQ